MNSHLSSFLNRISLPLFLLRVVVFFILVGAGTSLYGVLRSNIVEEFHQHESYTLGEFRGEQANRCTVLRAVATAGHMQLVARLDRGFNDDALNGWLKDFFLQAQVMVGTKRGINVWIIIDDEKLYTTNAAPRFDQTIASRPWYREAKAAKDAHVSPIYHEAGSGKPVVTVTAYDPRHRAMFGFDLYPGGTDMEIFSTPEKLYGHYFLTDHMGRPFLMRTDVELQMEAFAGIVEDWVRELKARRKTDAPLLTQGARTPVYVYGSELPNGNWVVHSRPAKHLDRQLLNLNLASGATTLCIVFLLLWGAKFLRRLEERLVHISSIVRTMFRSSELVVLINLRTGNYELLAGNDAVQRTLASEGAYEATMEKLAEAITSGRDDFVKSFSLESIRRHYADNDRSFGGEFEYRAEDGHLTWGQALLVLDHSVLPDEVILRIINVEQQHKVRSAETALLRTALDAARQSEHSKQLFFHSVSHEMRTPLNAICNMTTIAERAFASCDRTKMQMALGHIRHGADLLLRLVNDLLELAAARDGNVQLELRAFRLDVFLATVARSFADGARKDGKHFVTDFTDVDRPVSGDPVRLELVLNNLLSNALKYTASGKSVTFTVERITSCGDGEHFRFTIRDEGCGMSPEFLKTIFTPYAREERYHTREIRGTGLGMPIVKSLLQLMNGTIRIESQVGEGTTVVMTIPLEILAADDPRVRDLDAQGSESTSESQPVSQVEVREVDFRATTASKDAPKAAPNGVASTASSSSTAPTAAEPKPEQASVPGERALPSSHASHASHERGVDPEACAAHASCNTCLGTEASCLAKEKTDTPDGKAAAFGPGVVARACATAKKANPGTSVTETPSSSASAAEVASEKPLFLVAEDNLINQEILAELLDELGCAAEMADNGREAFEKFRDSAPGTYTAILMDVNMPEMNGLDATRAVRGCNHPDAFGIPIVAATANVLTEDIDEIYAAGMNAYLAKPIDFGKLSSIVKQLLARRHAR